MHQTFREATLAMMQQSKQMKTVTTLKNRFLANISHELRTPLVGLSGAVELLAKTEGLSKDQMELVGMIQSARETLTLHVNNLLDLSRIRADQVRLEARPFVFRQAVEGAFDQVAQLAASKGLDCDYIVEGHSLPVEVIGDAERIKQVCIHLLSNALKFTEKGSVLMKISHSALSSVGKSQFLISVTDTGIGISPKFAETAFDGFQQEDSSDSRTHGGFGVGLAICKALVELMGGRIWIESTSDQGTTMMFTLAAKTTDKVAPVVSVDTQKRVLLLIQGDQLRRVLESVLRPLVLVTVVNDIDAAAEQAQDEPPYVIISDLTYAERLLTSTVPVVIVAYTLEWNKWRHNKQAGFSLLSRPLHQVNIMDTLDRAATRQPESMSAEDAAKIWEHVLSRKTLEEPDGCSHGSVKSGGRLYCFHCSRALGLAQDQPKTSSSSSSAKGAPPDDEPFRRRFARGRRATISLSLENSEIDSTQLVRGVLAHTKIKEDQRGPCEESTPQTNQLFSARSSTDPAPLTPALRKSDVLIVDDVLMNRKVLSRMVGTGSYSFEVATNGQEAVDLCKEVEFSVILMDIQVGLSVCAVILTTSQMPVLDGLQASQQLRNMGLQTPILAVTASVAKEERSLCYNVGMNTVISKPYTKDQIIAAVAKWKADPTIFDQE